MIRLHYCAGMQRLQLFEFCDQKWLPDFVREAFHDCLAFCHHISYRPYTKLPKLLADISVRLKAKEIFDIASGGGEQIRDICDMHKKGMIGTDKMPRFILSDIYPNIESWKCLQKDFGSQAVSFYNMPVDFNHIPESAPRHWSIFTAFHHLSPPVAQNLINEAVARADSLLIAEVAKRTWLHIFIMILAMPSHILAPLFSRHTSFKKILVTTIIPIVPLMITFDGVVSVLRAYSREEIIAMLPKNWQDNFELEYKEMPTAIPFVKSTLFLLIRKNG